MNRSVSFVGPNWNRNPYEVKINVALIGLGNHQMSDPSKAIIAERTRKLKETCAKSLDFLRRVEKSRKANEAKPEENLVPFEPQLTCLLNCRNFKSQSHLLPS